MTVTQVQSFLGVCNYYQKFIKHYAQVAKPLYQLVSEDNAKAKRKEVEWSKECKEAFLKLKEICSNMLVLAYADYQRPFKVHTDASERSWLSNGLFVKDFMSICMGESLKYTWTIIPSPVC